MSWLFPDVKNISVTGDEVKKGMEPVQQLIGQQQGTIGQMQAGYGQSMGFARDMMDPRSAHNLQQRRLMEQQGSKSLALQNLLSRRQAAALGQESGVTQAQERLAGSAMGRDINQQWQQGLNQQYMQGLGQFNQSQGLLGQIGGMQSGIAGQQLGIQENITQAEIARRQMDMEMQQQDANRKAEFWGGIAGGVASGVGMGMTSSDIRLKENIDLIGKSPSGINIYEFDYKNKSYGNGRYRGVMAQEVPNASLFDSDGYLRVNYSKLDVAFERIS